MVDSLSRRFLYAFFTIAAVLWTAYLSFGVRASLTPVSGPCGKCPCCQMAAIDASMAVEPPGMRAAEPVRIQQTAAERMSCYNWMGGTTQDVTPYEWQFDGTPGIRADYRIVPGAPKLLAVQVEITELRNRWSVDLVDLYDVTADKRITSTAVWCSKGQPGYDPFRSLSNYTMADQEHEYRLEVYLHPEDDDAMQERDSVIDMIIGGKGLRVHSDFAMASGGTLK